MVGGYPTCTRVIIHMRLVVISDTHMHHDNIFVPEGDVLIHCGDFGVFGNGEEVGEACQWFRRQPHKRKICIAGNHDLIAEEDPLFMEDTLGSEVDYLFGSGTTVDGLYFWGSPIQPEFRDWGFNRDRKFRMDYWNNTPPAGIDVMITHCPPRGILDRNFRNELVGDKHLRRNVLERLRPKLHTFGHIHESRGGRTVEGIQFINASMVNLNLQPVFGAWVLDYERDGFTLISK